MASGGTFASLGLSQSLQVVSKGVAKKSFLTTATSVTFNTTLSDGGTPLVWAWPDGTFTTGNSPTKSSLAAGLKRLEVQSRDGFSSLVTFYCNNNSFSGTLPSFSTCTALVNFYCNNNSFSGTLPSFSTCTALVNFYAGYYGNLNQFSSVVPGSFSTQKSCSILWIYGSALPVSAVDQVLSDCVTSLGISGRVTCSLNLAGGTNATPDAAGLTSKATLVSAGWTVTTN